MPEGLFSSPAAMRLLDPERDAVALHAILGDDESCRYLPRPAFASVSETLEQLRKWTSGFEDTSWVTIDDTDKATGRISLYSPQPGLWPGLWDVACMIVPSARGQGLASRALPHAIDYVFEHKDARKITADIDPDNVGSIRTFEQLGFKLEGRLRAMWDTHIGVRDSLIYGLLPNDARPWKS